jgi:hypothetical protein
MSKTRDTGFLGNVVKYDANGNVTIVNGATTLLSVSSSGQLTVPGDEVITGSLTVLGGITGAITGSATSASYAANASLLNGSGSGEFVPTGSFNTFSSSILTYTGSVDSRLGSLETTSGSNITRLSALEVTSGSNITRISALETASGSAITRLNSIESKTGSYATTGSNTFVDGQYLSSSFNPTGFSTTASLYTDGGLRVTKDAYISGTLYLNNVTVFGTQSVAYISSSQLNIGTNLITVNTDTPSIRFGGLAVYDSGSTGLTGSILWDSQNNHWVYSNPSGSSYSGGMFISGPRTSTLGSETGTTSCMLLAGQGGDHLTSSMIYHDSTVTCIPGIITGGSDILLTAANPVVYGGTAVGGVSLSNNTGGSYIKIFGASHATTPNNTSFINANSTVLTINALGSVGIGTPTPCSVLHVYGVNPSLIIQNSNTGTVGNTSNIIFRNLLSTGCIHFAGYIAGIQQSTSANTGDLSFNTYNNGSVVEGMRITSAGIACFSNTVCTNAGLISNTLSLSCTSGDDRAMYMSLNCSANYNSGAANTIARSVNSLKFLWYNNCWEIGATRGDDTAIQALVFARQGNTYLAMTCHGIANFACRVCAPNINLSNGISINACSTVTVADWYNTNTDDGNGLYIKAGGVNSGKYVMALESAAGASRMIVLANGNVGIGTSTPLSILHIQASEPTLRISDNADGGVMFIGNTAGYSYIRPFSRDFRFLNAAGVSMFSITSAGNTCINNSAGIGGGLTVGSTISAGGSISGTLLTSTTQRLSNSTGGFANMVQKVYGASGGFSCLVICVNLNGAGGWGYIINTGGTSGGVFQSGGGYINGAINFSHNIAVGCGFTLTCHQCAGTDNVIRFIGGGGVHPFASIQVFGSLNQFINDDSIYIDYRN